MNTKWHNKIGRYGQATHIDFDSYMNEIGPLLDHVLIPHYEEKSLISEAKREIVRFIDSGISYFPCRDRIILCNQRLIFSEVLKIHNPFPNFEDYMQAGTFGLVEAIKKFDTSKPFKFSTYATHWIRRYLKDERVKSNTGKPVLTNAAVTIWYHYSRVQRNQPAPLSYAEVFAIISQLPQMKFLSFDTFCDTIRTMEAISYSLDYDSDSGIDILSDLPEYYDDEFQPVRDALSTLDPRTRRVISAFFGLDCQKLSLEDIGLEIGVTRERVRQIKERGVKEIRQYISRKPKLRYTGVA